ncbi:MULTISPECIES: GntR family transcriptional regulator [unclassified Sphingomonas]|uniref:GntR family transcriptional regulator n=1 Tax=unclassified Sphingomonas TaxID=196159 RepID=UPI00257AA1A6|nr:MULTISPECIES: GntR family transcriptional regulator [unclassified Sphingomonas]
MARRFHISLLSQFRRDRRAAGRRRTIHSASNRTQNRRYPSHPFANKACQGGPWLMDAVTNPLKSHDTKAESETATDSLLRSSVYEELRSRMITGKIVPGVSLSTRSLALEMGVSQMPVRDALSRLAAEGAVQIRSKRRIEVSPMTSERLDDILDSRLLLEPEAAVYALPNITPAIFKTLKEIDASLDQAMEDGDVVRYMEYNFRFHFTIYRANNRPVLNRLIESLWLQFGPFMRVVNGRYGTANLVDQHRMAMDAIQSADADALRDAIAADLRDGMGLLIRDTFSKA